MSSIDRRKFLKTAAAVGATALFGDAWGKPSAISWRERRDIFPEGVASGDPDSTSVLLWTRYLSQSKTGRANLRVEIAEDELFARVVGVANTRALANSDWTAAYWPLGSNPRVSTGIASQMARATAAESEERLLRHGKTIRDPYRSHSSVVKTRIREPRTPIGG